MLKQLAIATARLLPINVLASVARSAKESAVSRIVRGALRNRDLTINNGVARGVKFNSGESSTEFVLGTYELPIQQAFAARLRSGDVFYDIGANVGFFTIVAAKLVGETGKVYAFEPGSKNAAQIRHNAQMNNFSQVEVIEKAVSHTSGTGKLLLAQYSGGHALSTADAPPDLAGSMEVYLVAIDDLVEAGKILPPTVIKLDVEGAEVDALRGMTQTIKTHKPTIVYEVDDGEAESFQQKNREIANLIKSLGYKIEPLADSYQTIDWHVGHAIATPQE